MRALIIAAIAFVAFAVTIAPALHSLRCSANAAGISLSGNPANLGKGC